MQLSPRLAAIASLIPQGSVVADIGTDHALLPIYLIQQGVAGRVIAVENRPGILARARQTVSLFNQQYKIDLRLGDGLEPLRPEDEVDVVVVAGLGGRTICRLLHAGCSLRRGVRAFILQPMQEAPLLRRWLVAHGFRFLTERLVREGRRIYEIIVAGQGRERVADPLLYELGPVLVREKDPLLVPFIQQKIKRCQAISSSLRQSSREECRQKLNYYLQKEERLKEVLELVSHGQADS